eukprot:877094-Rhodomonas_salina.5
MQERLVLNATIGLRACYAMPGNDGEYTCVSAYARAMPGTDGEHGCVSAHARAMRCPVMRSRIVLYQAQDLQTVIEGRRGSMEKLSFQ